MKKDNIDFGKEFDWGKASKDYAKYRDIYPDEFYNKIIGLGYCKENQKVLDLATGTGVLPRNMYKFGAKWIGVDIAENQIKYAKLLSKDFDINYIVSPVENLEFEENSFDVVTACQCFMYFDKNILIPKIHKWLKAFDIDVNFTRDTWHGRIKACRGIGTGALSEKEISKWEIEHKAMLSQYPEKFTIPHYAAILDLKNLEKVKKNHK